MLLLWVFLACATCLTLAPGKRAHGQLGKALWLPFGGKPSAAIHSISGAQGCGGMDFGPRVEIPRVAIRSILVPWVSTKGFWFPCVLWPEELGDLVHVLSHF